MIEILKALAEENRLRIITLLIEQEMCVCEIEACLSMTQSNASRHLNSLKQCGILYSYKQAQWTYYGISERFKKEHKELWKYLMIKRKELPTYQKDCDEQKRCREINICDLCNKTH